MSARGGIPLSCLVWGVWVGRGRVGAAPLGCGCIYPSICVFSLWGPGLLSNVGNHHSGNALATSKTAR